MGSAEEALEGSGCAATAPPPPMPLAKFAFELELSFQGNVTHMSLIHSRSICKGKGQEAQPDVTVPSFFFFS